MADLITNAIRQSLEDDSKYASVSTLTHRAGTSQLLDQVAAIRFRVADRYTFHLHYRNSIQYFDGYGVGGPHSEGDETHVVEFRSNLSDTLVLRVVLREYPSRNELVGADPPQLSVELCHPSAEPLFEEIVQAAQPVVLKTWGQMEIRDARRPDS